MTMSKRIQITPQKAGPDFVGIYIVLVELLEFETFEYVIDHKMKTKRITGRYQATHIRKENTSNEYYLVPAIDSLKEGHGSLWYTAKTGFSPTKGIDVNWF
jgi:hypothetical protein